MRNVHELLTDWESMRPEELQGLRAIVHTQNGTVIDGSLETSADTSRCLITSLYIRDTTISVIRCWRNKDNSWSNELNQKLSAIILKENSKELNHSPDSTIDTTTTDNISNTDAITKTLRRSPTGGCE